MSCVREFYLSVFLLKQAGGGRNEVDTRFLSLFSVYNVTFPSAESLFHIYSSVLIGHVKPFKKGKLSLADMSVCGCKVGRNGLTWAEIY